MALTNVANVAASDTFLTWRNSFNELVTKTNSVTASPAELSQANGIFLVSNTDYQLTVANTNSWITTNYNTQRSNLANTNARVTLVNTNLTSTNTALRSLITTNAATELSHLANTNAYIEKMSTDVQLANTNLRIDLVNTNLTSTNTALRTLISTNAATELSHLANTNTRVDLVNTNLTGTNTAIRSLVTAEAARTTLVNTNLTGTNTALRTLISDRYQVANADAKFLTKNGIEGSQSVTGQVSFTNIVVSGNLMVSGTTTNVNTTQVNIANSILVLNHDLGSANPSENAEIRVNRGNAANVSLYWDEANEKWKADSGGNAALLLLDDGTYSTNAYATSIGTRVTLVNTNLTGTNTALRTLISDRMQVANTVLLVNDRIQMANVSHLYQTKATSNTRLANTNNRIDLINTNLTGTNTAVRSLITAEAARTTLVNTNLTGTNTALRTLISDRMQVANTVLLVNDRIQMANVSHLYQTKATSNTRLANTNNRIDLVNTNLTSTNTALRTLISTNAATELSHLANTNAYIEEMSTDVQLANTNLRIDLVNTNLTSTNTAVRSLITTEAARTTLVNTNLTGTNTALRTLISDRMQVANTVLLVNDRIQMANVSHLYQTKATSNTRLANTNTRIDLVNENHTKSNTELRTLISDRLQVANAEARYSNTAQLANTNARVAATESSISTNAATELSHLANTNAYIATNAATELSHLANTNARVTLVNTNLTSTNTAVRSLISTNASDIATKANTAGGILSGDVTIHATSVSSDTLALVDTSTGADATPNFVLFRDSSSPADNDYGGKIRWDARNDAGQVFQQAYILPKTVDASDGTEDAFVILGVTGDGAAQGGSSGGGIWYFGRGGQNSLQTYGDFYIGDLNHYDTIKIDTGGDVTIRDKLYANNILLTTKGNIESRYSNTAQLANTNTRVAATESSISTNAATELSHLANTNARVTLVNTNLTSTNTAIRSLVTAEAARTTLVNTNLTGTNTALRTLISDRYQVANANARFLTKNGALSNQSVDGQVVFDNVVVSGNLMVSGTMTNVNSTTVNIANTILVLNHDLGSNKPSESAELRINRGDAANAALIWNETTEKWALNSGGNTANILLDNGTYSTNAYATSIGTRVTLVNTNLTGTNTAIRSLITTNAATELSHLANTNTYIATMLPKAGGTMTGDLVLSGADVQLNLGANTAIKQGTANSVVFQTANTAGLQTRMSIDSTGTVNIPDGTSSTNRLAIGTGNDLSLYQSGAWSTIVANSAITMRSAGQFFIDTASYIILDSDLGRIDLNDGSLAVGRIDLDSQNLTLHSVWANKSIIFKGDNGGGDGTVVALTLDMSDSGKATFNDVVEATGLTITGKGSIESRYSNTAQLANTNSRVAATESSISTNAATELSHLANTNTYIATMLPKAGGTMTGDLVLSGADVQLNLGANTAIKQGSANTIVLQTGKAAGLTTALTIDSSQDATFAGDVEGATLSITGKGSIESRYSNTAQLATETARITLVNTNLTGTNTAVRSLISTNAATELSHLANTNTYIATKADKNNTALTGTISANGSVGTAGYVLTSAGAGVAAFWDASSGGGSGDTSTLVSKSNTGVQAIASSISLNGANTNILGGTLLITSNTNFEKSGVTFKGQALDTRFSNTAQLANTNTYIATKANTAGGTFSGDVAIHSTSVSSDTLALVDTTTGLDATPNFVLFRDSSSPADNDYGGKIRWDARNDAGQVFQQAYFLSKTVDASDGTEDAVLLLGVMGKGINYGGTGGGGMWYFGQTAKNSLQTLQDGYLGTTNKYDTIKWDTAGDVTIRDKLYANNILLTTKGNIESRYSNTAQLANTNSRVAATESSISTNAATELSHLANTNAYIASMSTDVQLANTNAYIGAVVTSLNQRLGETATVALTGDVTASATAFSSNTVSITTAIGSGVIIDADVNSGAAIAWSKMANLTASRALYSDGSGDVTVSDVTSTELGYLDGVSSAIQTQMDTKQTVAQSKAYLANTNAYIAGVSTTASAALPKAGGTMTGDLVLSGVDVQLNLGANTAIKQGTANSMVFQTGKAAGLTTVMTIDHTGIVEITKDQSIDHDIGRSTIGTFGQDWANFSHIDHSGAAGAGFRQSSAGKTEINTPAGQTVAFRIGNVDKMHMDTSGNFVIGSGVTDPAAAFEVRSGEIRMSDGRNLQWGGTNCRIQGTNAGNFQLFTAGAETFTVNNNGITKVQQSNAAIFTDATNSGSITLDFTSYTHFHLTLTGNITLANPSTEISGTSGLIYLKQDGTGSRTLSLGTDYEKAGGGGYTLSTGVANTDAIPYYVIQPGKILLGSIVKGIA